MLRRKIEDFLIRLLALAIFLIAAPCAWVVDNVPYGSVTLTAVSFSFSIILIVIGLSIIVMLRDRRRKLWQKSLKTLKVMQKEPMTSQGGNNLLKAYKWRELEFYTAQVFSAAGYKTRVTRRAADGGVDVKMRNPNGGIEVVECKQWSQPIGVGEIRKFITSMTEFKAKRGYFVAPSGFTQPARDLARKYKIVLVDNLEWLTAVAEGKPHYSKIEGFVRGAIIIALMFFLIVQGITFFILFAQQSNPVAFVPSIGVSMFILFAIAMFLFFSR